MIESGKIDRICLAAAILAIVISLLLVIAAVSSPPAKVQEKSTLGVSDEYAALLFDDSFVHVIDIEVSEASWQYMVRHAMEEQYVLCDAVIDGERISQIAIRPKGNSSLASIAGQGSDRFSFKIEFDHYHPGNTYHGLDKLALNNLGQDVSAMKDYLSYRMMQEMNVPGPLCSYTLVQLNGKDFGLYLAVEGIEDSFVCRNYGEWKGNLYRPDVYAIESISPSQFMDLPLEQMAEDIAKKQPGDRADILGPIINRAFSDVQELVRISAGGYAGENPDAYRVVFDTAVFDADDTDRSRYISAVRALDEAASAQDALDMQALCDYFAVHNFVNNYDSYTGIFSHNYYICERDGKLSLVPWDYNLGFGAFSVESAYNSFVGGTKWYVPLDFGKAMSSDKSFVNYPIDTPLISAEMEMRPLFSRLIADETGLALYHDACARLLKHYFADGVFARWTTDVSEMIRPYVQQGLTFYEEAAFDRAVDAVQRYGQLRAESIQGQLDGRIPATLDGQSADYANLIEIDGLDLSKTIDFGGLAFGITSEEVCNILEVVFDGRETTDVDALMADLSANPAEILPLALRVIGSSKLISGAIVSAAAPPAVLVVCVMALVIMLRSVRRKRGKGG